jgi:hypothetical protein
MIIVRVFATALTASLLLAGGMPARAANVGAVTTLEAHLTGPAEIPGPGDDNGSGRAIVNLYADLDIVCWTIGVKRIELPATLAHIHRGTATEAGPVQIDLSAPDLRRRSRGCVAADSALIDEIIGNPAGFYVNVHNKPFPGGAVRGQLEAD